ncbi:hypothetical protein P7D22_03565 [Lichenihabitans sp. Uapishka_5]|uniref:hypothetical protein n=1 Tax=Lichenihabitans sp. Uapishka_5 TaxID=3037302 RepID=UPI0029E7CC59|nr:hypothetical protein [Lichenihabitans sp. Uapishka_5]MDX7950256.1 hypothetical protein [Lichenihabitans sp. Uapishka_5]
MLAGGTGATNVCGRAWAATQRYLGSASLAGPTGPSAIGVHSAVLALSRGSRYPVPIAVSLYLPLQDPPRSGASSDCVAWLARNPPPHRWAKLPVILFAPGNGGGRDDAASSLANLASHGFLVIAIDDVSRDKGLFARFGATIPALGLGLSTAEDYAATLREGAAKVRQQADKALAALDRVMACAAQVPAWAERVDDRRSGFLGFSLGGATAAEAGIMDGRIQAVLNLDGWIFGQALSGGLDKPYALVLSDDAAPSDDQRRSTAVADRNYVELTDRLIRDAFRLSGRYGGCVTRIVKAKHEGFTDEIFERRFARSWLSLDPDRMKAIHDDMEVAFFERLRAAADPFWCKALLARWPELQAIDPVALR